MVDNHSENKPSPLSAEILQRLQNLRRATHSAIELTTEAKNKVLLLLARKLKNSESMLLEANAKDVNNIALDVAAAFRDRLRLTSSRIESMAESLRHVAKLEDPVHEVVENRVLANGLQIQKTRSPLGVIFVIFESRPNVAIEAFSLAFKSGNALILKGGKEARHTTSKLYDLVTEALNEQGIDSELFWGMPEAGRDLVASLLKQTSYIDVVIPRGGDRLIEFVTEQSRIPIIKNDRGLCHVYVDKNADLKMALEIIDNAKTQRPGVCNSIETILVHGAVAKTFLPELANRLAQKNVEVRGCAKTLEALKSINSTLKLKKATNQDWDTEYLDLILNCKVVETEDEAIEHIRQHGSKHSEAIITASADLARRFQRLVDAAAVYWNASTRFTDGFELGLGAEIGISTQKLHVRGPVGLRELTSVRWVIDGQGQIRQS